MIYYISPGQLGTTAYITRAVALIYVIGGLQANLLGSFSISLLGLIHKLVYRVLIYLTELNGRGFY